MTPARYLGGGLAIAALSAAPLLGITGTALASDAAAAQAYHTESDRGWSQTTFAADQGNPSDDMADEPWRVNKDWNWVKDWCVNHTKESKLPEQASSYAGISCPTVWPND